MKKRYVLLLTLLLLMATVRHFTKRNVSDSTIDQQPNVSTLELDGEVNLLGSVEAMGSVALHTELLDAVEPELSGHDQALEEVEQSRPVEPPEIALRKRAAPNRDTPDTDYVVVSGTAAWGRIDTEKLWNDGWKRDIYDITLEQHERFLLDWQKTLEILTLEPIALRRGGDLALLLAYQEHQNPDVWKFESRYLDEMELDLPTSYPDSQGLAMKLSLGLEKGVPRCYVAHHLWFYDGNYAYGGSKFAVSEDTAGFLKVDGNIGAIMMLKFEFVTWNELQDQHSGN